ncbi:seminase-like [Drosophila bipectinata]|uniref:seminase-like n=1 Tax=Drosophila bipectinata TaxID=42026 RepID=UPI001C8AA8F1|nr:seminase-like [Drosophila bipectinata]
MECLWALLSLLAVSIILAEDLNKTIGSQRPQPRVINGHLITNEKLGGYLIAMRYNDEFVCGGTLIKDTIVLTAAHCFIRRYTKSKWLAEGGISTLTEEGVQRHIKDFAWPQTFRKKTMNMDVAVVLLDMPMVGLGIDTIPLCSHSVTTSTMLRVSGWGLTYRRTIEPENYLRAVAVPVIDRNQCRQVYRPKIRITINMICAAVLGEKDACIYDSGGPLVYNNEVCGIVSFGIGCASKKYPGVYTDVYTMASYIKKTIKKFLMLH